MKSLKNHRKNITLFSFLFICFVTIILNRAYGISSIKIMNQSNSKISESERYELHYSKKIQSCKAENFDPLLRNENLVFFAKKFKSFAIPFFKIKGNQILETNGQEVKSIKHLYRINDRLKINVKPKVSYDEICDHAGVLGCIWNSHSELINQPYYTILATSIIRVEKPNQIDEQKFYEIDHSCVHQGEHPIDQMPPCKKPELIAVSDLNQNGKKEYWHTVPTTYRDGFAFSEINESQRSLISLAESDPDCW